MEVIEATLTNDVVTEESDDDLPLPGAWAAARRAKEAERQAQNAAAITLQSATRRFLAKDAYQAAFWQWTQRILTEDAAVRVQSITRRKAAAARVDKERAARTAARQASAATFMQRQTRLSFERRKPLKRPDALAAAQMKLDYVLSPPHLRPKPKHAPPKRMVMTTTPQDSKKHREASDFDFAALKAKLVPPEQREVRSTTGPVTAKSTSPERPPRWKKKKSTRRRTAPHLPPPKPNLAHGLFWEFDDSPTGFRAPDDDMDLALCA